MASDALGVIESRANPRFKALKKLIEDHSHYKQSGLVWIEGDHLADAAIHSGVIPQMVVMAQDFASASIRLWSRQTQVVVLSNALFAQISPLPSSASMGLLIKPNLGSSLDATLPTVVLDRIQDAGNVGSILRSAAAFGFTQVIALEGTASLWGPKTLRAGMGAHFSLKLREDVTETELDRIQPLPWLATSSHAEKALLQEGLRLPWPCAWFLGNEGQGLRESLEKRCLERVRINQPGGQESLNVAAAASICLFASSLGRI